MKDVKDVKDVKGQAGGQAPFMDVANHPADPDHRCLIAPLRARLRMK